ncbi:MAG: metallophosphoesterase [Aeromicrobium sp.]|nr:metallophosphoesterase [Burkholderiales bacterium]
MHKLFVAAFVLAFILPLGGCATQAPIATGPNTFQFGLIGDQQYNEWEERQFPRLLAAMDREPLAFVVHVGDFKAGSNAPCTDVLFQRRFQELNQSKHPLIFTPGDNDWVDCRRPTNGVMNPLERLNKLREIFFSKPESLGQSTIKLTPQSQIFANDLVLSRYQENVLWVQSGVVFATLNIQGSNDNVGFDRDNDAEQTERTKANIAWLKFAIERASSADILGLAIFLQANPGFEESPAAVAKSAYVPFLQAFEREVEKFGKPTLFAHGDTHEFRVDRPYRSPLNKRAIENVTRVEGYGSPRVNWVRIGVDTNNRQQPFQISSGGFVPSPD